jgi:cysteine desulfurase/selenocysteine lyase
MSQVPSAWPPRWITWRPSGGLRSTHKTIDRGLSAIRGVRVLAGASQSVGVRSFVVDGRNSVELQRALAERGVDVRAGHLSAGTLLRQFGTAHAVRVSVAPYNNDDDIDRCLAALREVVR